MQLTKGKVVTITSVKGGVGKTTFLLTLAATYKRQNKKILIIDMDLFSGDIEAILNVQSKRDVYTLFEDITNNNFYEIDNYITKYDDNIDFIAATKDPRYASKVNGRFLNLLFNRVASKYDVILVDTNHILDEINLMILDNSYMSLYLITNDLMNLKNMKNLVSIFKDADKKNFIICLNYSCDIGKNYLSLFDIRNIIKANIDYTINSSFNIKNIDKYILDGEILTLNRNILKNHSNDLNHLKMIANDLIDDKHEEV